MQSTIPLPDGKSTAENLNTYQRVYKMSIEKPEVFWSRQARNYPSWIKEPNNIGAGTFIEGDINFFAGGKLNVSYNCIGRLLAIKGDQVAIIWEADEVGEGRALPSVR